MASKKEFTQRVRWANITSSHLKTTNSELCCQWAIFPQEESISKSFTYILNVSLEVDGQYVDIHFMGNYFLGFI